MHSFAAMGKVDLAVAIYAAENDNAPPPVVRLRDAIAARYGFKSLTDAPDERWILDQETEVLLQAA